MDGTGLPELRHSRTRRRKSAAERRTPRTRCFNVTEAWAAGIARRWVRESADINGVGIDPGRDSPHVEPGFNPIGPGPLHQCVQMRAVAEATVSPPVINRIRHGTGNRARN